MIVFTAQLWTWKRRRDKKTSGPFVCYCFPSLLADLLQERVFCSLLCSVLPRLRHDARSIRLSLLFLLCTHPILLSSLALPFFFIPGLRQDVSVVVFLLLPSYVHGLTTRVSLFFPCSFSSIDLPIDFRLLAMANCIHRLRTQARGGKRRQKTMQGSNVPAQTSPSHVSLSLSSFVCRLRIQADNEDLFLHPFPMGPESHPVQRHTECLVCVCVCVRAGALAFTRVPESIDRHVARLLTADTTIIATLSLSPVSFIPARSPGSARRRSPPPPMMASVNRSVHSRPPPSTRTRSFPRPACLASYSFIRVMNRRVGLLLLKCTSSCTPVLSHYSIRVPPMCVCV